MAFQRNWARHAQGKCLNIGACDDPVGLGVRDHPAGLNLDVVHFDLDFWPHKQFVQGDAHNLSIFSDRAFDMVFMGDIHEHLLRPLDATLEAARVAKRALCMSIFEEWRLSGPGQHVEEGLALGDEKSRELGFADRQDYQVKTFPQRQGYDDNELPHLVHINQFVDDDIEELVWDVVQYQPDWQIVQFTKEAEATHQGHEWSNWLVMLVREEYL